MYGLNRLNKFQMSSMHKSLSRLLQSYEVSILAVLVETIKNYKNECFL